MPVTATAHVTSERMRLSKAPAAELAAAALDARGRVDEAVLAQG